MNRDTSDGSRIGDAAILLAASGYGLATTLSVAALDRVRPADLVAVELAGAAIVLFAFGLLRGLITRDGARRNVLLGALMPGLAFALGDSGLSRTSATAGTLLLAAELPLSILAAVVFLRESLRGWSVVALGVGLIGSTVVAFGASGSSGSEATTVGNLLVVGSVAAAAVFLVVTRRHNGDDGLNATAWQVLGGAMSTVPFVAFGWLRHGSELPHAGPIGWALCLGILATTALAGVAFNWGISRVTGVRASQLSNLTPVVGLMAAMTILREIPSGIQLLGGAMVLLSLVILVRAVHPVDDRPRAAVLDEVLVR
jgi:drug/metabolite transporter (DMT)-like permease